MKKPCDGTRRIKFGVIGCGRWGKNYVRLLHNKPDIELDFIADTDPDALHPLQAVHKEVHFVSQGIEKALQRDIDAVIIATPVEQHFQLSKAALLSGKHVLCEKPVAIEVSQVCELKKLAQEHNLIFLPGHIFIYNRAVSYIKEQIEQAALGDIYHITVQRAGLGPVRKDVNVLYDLAIHDLAILNYILDEKPEKVKAITSNCLSTLQEDVAFLFLKYRKNLMASIMVSWLHPNKTRKFCIVGSQKMLVFDDVDNAEKIRVFDKGIDYQPVSGDFGEFQLSVRDGNIYTPNIKYGEPLEIELDDFINCIRTRNETKVAPNDAVDIAKILHAASQSAKHDSKWVNLPF